SIRACARRHAASAGVPSTNPTLFAGPAGWWKRRNQELRLGERREVRRRTSRPRLFLLWSVVGYPCALDEHQAASAGDAGLRRPCARAKGRADRHGPARRLL